VQAAQTGMDLASGPVFRVVLSGNRLFVAAHHLVVDGVSWRILLEDLESAYRQAAGGRDVDLGAKTTSFQDWAHRLAEYTVDGGFDEEIDYWAGVHGVERTALPVDHTGENTIGTARAVSVELTEEETDALLHHVPAVYRTQINDVLLAALGRVLSDWTGDNRVAIELEGHGREELFDDLDISRTVGWFTTRFPVALDVPGASAWRTVIRSIRRQLRAVPNKGIGYGSLRYLKTGSPLAEPHETPEVTFNYLGQLDSAMTPDSPLYLASLPAPGGDRSPAGPRTQVVGVLGRVHEGRMRFDWVYSTSLHDEDTIRRLADRFTDALREIADGHR
jgi:non-ribosomal peptide synthase protein (TIGR01720 family)